MPQTKGRLHFIGPETQVTESFRKKDFAIIIERYDPETGDKFTHFEAFQLNNDKTRLLDGFMQGDKIEVSYQVRSNFSDKDGQARYFTNLNAYKIVKLAETQQSGQQQAATPPPQQADQAEQESQDSAAQTPHDGSPDLPF